MKLTEVVQTNEAFIDPRELINRANELVAQANQVTTRGGADDNTVVQIQKIVNWITPNIEKMKSSHPSEFQGHKFAAYLDKLQQILG